MPKNPKGTVEKRRAPRKKMGPHGGMCRSTVRKGRGPRKRKGWGKKWYRGGDLNRKQHGRRAYHGEGERGESEKDVKHEKKERSVQLQVIVHLHEVAAQKKKRAGSCSRETKVVPYNRRQEKMGPRRSTTGAACLLTWGSEG